MFERYDELARQVIFFGRFEAGAFGAEEIDTEHLLLGLMRADPPLLPRLVGGPIDVEAVRQQVQERAGAEEAVPEGDDIPLSMAGKHVLAHAFEEANGLNHAQIGAEHLLLGLLLEETSCAARILRELGLSSENVREDLAKRNGGV